MAFAGFSPRVRFTPVPDPLFGPLLEQIGDLSELKATLRIIWLLHQKKGYPRYVTHGELLADRVLARGLSVEGREPGPELERALKMAVRRGTLVTGAEDGRERLYALNTERDRRAIDQGAHAPRTTGAEPATSEEERRNIFVLYEDSIGILNPMIAETLKEAEQSYPEPWFEDAFREAVENNKRSWRYVAAILDRWEREGKSDGGPGRYSKETGYQKHFRR